MNVDKSYQLVLDNLKPPSTLTRLAPEAMLLLLRCISSLESSDMQVQAIKNIDCLMTNLGYRHPCECFLLNPEESEWGCLLQVFTPIPILDDKFYGTSIFSMSNELRKIGVKVDFEEVMKEFTCTFKQHASQSSITKQHVLSFLRCYRNLKKLELKIPDEFTNYIRQEKWIMTRLGDYKSPNECILFGTDWERVISSNSMLLFIDDSNEFYGRGIHDFREELKELGVVTDFKDGAKRKHKESDDFGGGQFCAVAVFWLYVVNRSSAPDSDLFRCQASRLTRSSPSSAPLIDRLQQRSSPVFSASDRPALLSSIQTVDFKQFLPISVASFSHKPSISSNFKPQRSISVTSFNRFQAISSPRRSSAYRRCCSLPSTPSFSRC
ncbi:hypothetical protein LXL04_030782 [Taraxacum kok-saghyz]